jgi:hypothetical protein
MKISPAAMALTLVLALCTSSADARAQTWADAVQKGDYVRAAELLHAIAADAETALSSEATPLIQLGTMYAQGRGVPTDPVLACTLFDAAMASVNVRSYPGSPVWTRTSELVNEHCDRLTRDDRMDAAQSIGCFAFGLTDQTLVLGGRSIHISRHGIEVDRAARVELALNCPQQVALVRGTTVGPPEDAAPGVKSRHFVELFYWQAGKKDGVPLRSLQWQVLVLRGDTLQMRLMQELERVSGSFWANPALPSVVETQLTLQMIRSGHIRWRLATTPSQHGWIMLPEESERR